LPSAEMRAALTAGWPEVDAALATLADGATDDSREEAFGTTIRADDNRYDARAKLQLLAWTAAFRDIESGDLRAMQDTRQTPAATAAGSKASAQSRGARRAEFSARLHDLVRDLPADIARGATGDLDLSYPASRNARLAHLRNWNRLLRLVDP